jgi:hypothetical protein
VAAARQLNVIVHVTKDDKGWRSNIHRRTTRRSGYAISLSRRWLVEKTFGWLPRLIAQGQAEGLREQCA